MNPTYESANHLSSKETTIAVQQMICHQRHKPHVKLWLARLYYFRALPPIEVSQLKHAL